MFLARGAITSSCHLINILGHVEREPPSGSDKVNQQTSLEISKSYIFKNMYFAFLKFLIYICFQDNWRCSLCSFDPEQVYKTSIM